jgi:hypothetical protein
MIDLRIIDVVNGICPYCATGKKKSEKPLLVIEGGGKLCKDHLLVTAQQQKKD